MPDVLVNHPDGLIEEIGRMRSRGDILEFLAAEEGELHVVKLPRTILEVMVEVTILSGRRPAVQQLDFEGHVLETRNQKPIMVRLTETGRHVKNCRNKLDKAKVEAFLDHNGLFDKNHVVK